MHFVVTGGAGFVGSHLVKLLLEEGHKITVIDNLRTGKKENLSEVIDKIQFLNLDIRDYDSMEKNMRNVDGVFHQAALTVVQDSLENPKEYHDVNVVGTENIFKIAAKNKFNGNKQQTPISENAERIPINPYGKTKLEDEYLMEKYSKLGVEIIGLRYFNIFGKGQTMEYAGVITKFLDRINEGKPPIIFGSGSQIRDFVYVGDIVKANLMAMTSNTSNLLVNIRTGDSISILELAKMMIKISELNLEPIIAEPLEGDVEKSHADISLAKRSLGWESEVKLEDWLKETIDK